MVKRFFYVSAGILCAALAYHIGAGRAVAQSSGASLVAAAGDLVYAGNGDAYQVYLGPPATFTFIGNVFTGSPTPLRQESWGSMKARYRGERQPVTQGR